MRNLWAVWRERLPNRSAGVEWIASRRERMSAIKTESAAADHVQLPDTKKRSLLRGTRAFFNDPIDAGNLPT